MTKFLLSVLLLLPSTAFAAGGGHYTWLSLFTHDPKLYYVVASLLIFAVILLIGVYVQLNKARILATDIPLNKVSFLGALEVLTEGILGIVRSLLPHNSIRYVPLTGALVLYIFLSNIASFIPGFLSPSTSISNNLAMGLCSFIFYNYCGFKEHGVGYLKQFAGPMIILAPFMFVLELISHALRPMSLSLRLFGNMNGDHTVLTIFSGLAPLFVPVVFLGLGLLVCLIQTYIFTILSLVYTSMATSHDH